MIFYSTFDILDEVLYKGKIPGIVSDVSFSLNEETGYIEESYGIVFDDNSYILDVSPNDMSYSPTLIKTNLS